MQCSTGIKAMPTLILGHGKGRALSYDLRITVIKDVDLVSLSNLAYNFKLNKCLRTLPFGKSKFALW